MYETKALAVAGRMRGGTEAVRIAAVSGNARITASMGLTTICGSGITPEELIALVDKNTYEAKRIGKNCIVESDLQRSE